MEGRDRPRAPGALQGRGGPRGAEADPEPRSERTPSPTQAHPSTTGASAEFEPVARRQDGSRGPFSLRRPSHPLPSRHGRDSKRAGPGHRSHNQVIPPNAEFSGGRSGPPLQRFVSPAQSCQIRSLSRAPEFPQTLSTSQRLHTSIRYSF